MLKSCVKPFRSLASRINRRGIKSEITFMFDFAKSALMLHLLFLGSFSALFDYRQFEDDGVAHSSRH